MAPIRILGSVLGLASGLWSAFVSLYGVSSPQPCSSGEYCSKLAQGPPPIGTFPSSMSEAHWALFLLGSALAIVSLVSFSGIRLSFVAGAILSAGVLVTLVVWWGTYTNADETAAAVVAALALVVDAVASRPSKGLSEKDSPLNLPVFG